MELDASFGQWVFTRRKLLRLTRAETAAQLGCATVTLRKIEEDARRPSQQLARLLAERLGIALSDRANFVRVARGELSVEHLLTLPLRQTLPTPAPRNTTQHAGIPTPPHTNLPALLTSFVGRASDLND